jgi:hypothetical protein
VVEVSGMKKLLILAIFCILAALVVPAFAVQPEAPADGIKLNKGGKKEVIFNHSSHKEVDCVSCHHLVDNKEDYRACATAGCHDAIGQKEKGVNSYHQSIHKVKDVKHQSCVSCHTQVAGTDKDKKKELTGCAKSKCHP